MELTTPILKDLSHQIAHGNPWWGLVVTNEYLSSGSPLHRALVAQFLKRVGQLQAQSPLAQKLIDGARFNELDVELQTALGKRETFKRQRELPSSRFQSFERMRSQRIGRARRLPLTPRRAISTSRLSLRATNPIRAAIRAVHVEPVSARKFSLAQ